jgi:hypothetical protein
MLSNFRANKFNQRRSHRIKLTTVDVLRGYLFNRNTQIQDPTGSSPDYCPITVKMSVAAQIAQHEADIKEYKLQVS